MVGLGQKRFGGGGGGGGGNCLKYLKRGGTEKRGGDTKILRKEASWVKGWGVFLTYKKWVLEPPYKLWLRNVIFS